MARAIKLIDAPIGLFEVDGVLVLKTEYSTRHEDGTITPDCYIIESGEYFWGGVDSAEERNNLEVALVDMPTLTPQNEWVSVENAVPDPGERVLATDGIFVGEAYRTSADSWHRHTGFPWRDGVTGRTVKYWMPLPAPPDRRQPEGKGEKS